MVETRLQEDKWVKTMCWGCVHGMCDLRVHVVDGVAVNVEGDVEGPGFDRLTRNQGKICPKPYGQLQKLYNPYRIRTPLKRTNPEKGIGVDPKWVEISWDEALDTVASKLKEARDKDPRRIIYGCGRPQRLTLSGTIDALLQAIGPVQLYSGGTAKCDGAEHIFGNFIHGGFACEGDLDYCNYLVLVGGNPMDSGGVAEVVNYSAARARGMKMVVVDPVFTPTAAKADEWQPIRPGTDLAFLLALIHTILHEIGKYDASFLKTLTNSPYLVGPDGYFARDRENGKVLIWDPAAARAKSFDAGDIADFSLEGSYKVAGIEVRPAFQVLKDHVKAYTPEWAAAICQIPADTIRRIAGEWVSQARIGSTIEIEGLKLPLRPVAMKMGRGVTGVMRSYQVCLSVHILAALVGALEVPGGHIGGSGPRIPYMNDLGVAPGPDGLRATKSFDFTWPPVSYDGLETLLPYNKIWHVNPHLAFRNLADPPKNFPMPPPPEVYVKHRTNPMLVYGEPEVIAKVLKQIPFTVSIAYVMDETTEFADIVLPDRTEYETWDLVRQLEGNRHVTGKKIRTWIVRQPAVEPPHNIKEIADVCTELAERMGILAEYNQAVNAWFNLVEPYRLEPGRKYSWVEMVDAHCQSLSRSLTGQVYDLQWFKENGGIVKAVTAEEQYEVDLEMLKKKLRYPVPYMEHVKKTGDELRQNLARVGIDWWPTNEYVALPVYLPSILDEVAPEYDFYAITRRAIIYGYGANVDLPWLMEVGQHLFPTEYMVMNADAAKARGIRDGDEIWVESDVGKVKGKVRLSEGIRPDTLLITGQFGNWSMPVARDTARVTLSTLTPIRQSWTDHVVGCMQGIALKVKVYRA